MKLIKVLVIFLGILLLCVGCSQDLLKRLLQQDSEAEIDHETLGILLAHICYDSVDQVFEQTVDAEGFSWETNANNQPFTINIIGQLRTEISRKQDLEPIASTPHLKR